MALAPITTSSPPAAPPGYLPGALSSFVGRTKELAEVTPLLAAYRLLTLTGPGGCGKTRLALRLAGEVRADYPDGVWLVEFAPLADEALVSPAVAAALGVAEQTGAPLSDTLARHLRDRQALLLLDNCEHLIDACARLSAQLLAACPGVRLLATSRESLRIPGEGVWAVPPMSLPPARPWQSPAAADEALRDYRASEAIQLFVARAQAVAPGFELTVENGSWVAEICRRLDGMPLAIELAAARVPTHPVRDIAERLDNRFQLLTGGRRTVPQRQQTLEATLDWSYDLLSPQEQMLLQRLSVFASGWTAEAARAVCGEPLAVAEVLPLLDDLVNKSLVTVERAPGRRRYGLLETIRQYAARKLPVDDAGTTRNRHLDYFARWATSAEPYWQSLEQAEWLARFDSEHDNLRAALEWGAAGGDVEVGLTLAAACWKYWRVRGYLSEGRERLSAVLSRDDARQPTAARAWALLRESSLAYIQSDFPAVGTPAEEALAIFRGLGPSQRRGVAQSLDVLAELATEMGEYDAAPAMFEEALAIFRDLDDDVGVADMLLQLGWAAMRTGDYARAEERLHESLPLFRSIGDSHFLGFALSGLGELAIRQRQFDRAQTFLAESLDVRATIGERWGIAASLGSLGWVALLRHDFGQTRDYLRRSLAIRLDMGDRGGTAWCLEKLAEAITIETQALPAARRRAILRRAVMVFGAADALRRPLNSVIDPTDQPDYERTLAALRQTLGEAEFEHAWGEGGRLSLDQAVETALTPPLAPGEAASLVGAAAEKLAYGGLSARERETARLIALGLSNREIAARMTVGEKTVETYVTRILNKLGFSSRVQIATWAVERGLASADS